VGRIQAGREPRTDEVWKLTQGSYLTGESIVIGGGLIVG
jgi:hypothetical protein